MILRIGLLFLILPPAVLLGAYFSELSTVNECIRNQGSFDYVQMLCDQQQKHAFIPYFSRHPLMVNGALILSVIGVVLCAVGLYTKQK